MHHTIKWGDKRYTLNQFHVVRIGQLRIEVAPNKDWAGGGFTVYVQMHTAHITRVTGPTQPLAVYNAYRQTLSVFKALGKALDYDVER